MPPRVTRASARLTAGSSNPTDEQSSPPHPPLPSRKRKAAKQEPSPEPPVVAPEIPSRKRAKRIKAEPAEAPPPPPEPRKTRKSSRATAAMSTPGYVWPHDATGQPVDRARNQPDPFEEQPSNVASTSSIKRKSNRKKGANGKISNRANSTLTNAGYRNRRSLFVNCAT
jgi:E3 ubiquitin-protein ligase TRIP12